ncbi:unnamed protein product [Paramecium sonneborni]|uniref:Ribosomal protein L29 n=1 Tax=Paramecium sonneborni TaxID=65129 RepID=A0A8S1NFI7_9CILI|nr:unnamed protein product [Paramecium sonneborni]
MKAQKNKFNLQKELEKLDINHRLFKHVTIQQMKKNLREIQFLRI